MQLFRQLLLMLIVSNFVAHGMDNDTDRRVVTLCKEAWAHKWAIIAINPYFNRKTQATEEMIVTWSPDESRGISWGNIIRGKKNSKAGVLVTPHQTLYFDPERHAQELSYIEITLKKLHEYHTEKYRKITDSYRKYCKAS